jgi:predicted adenylyl cyclase CyaB
MYEVEVKILEIDRQSIEEKLLSLGAKKVFDAEVHSLYYDNDSKVIRKAKGALRLRRKGKESVLTFKHHKEDGIAKVRFEEEVEVSDFDTMRSILNAIGFSSWLEMRKHRTTYECDGVYFELDRYADKYEFIPEFLEIEGPDISSIFKYVKLLGFSEHDCRPWDSMQVIEHYSR